MTQPVYRDVWSRRIGLGDEKPDPEVRRILELLDPYYGNDCPKCGGSKQEGELVCQVCARACPDPDHRETWFAHADPPMCPNCAGWLVRLDMPCLFNPSKACDDPTCATARESGSGSFCDGRPKIRDGFFVYQLDTGYIGMTYNPSQRQIEHEVKADVDRRERLRRDSFDPIQNPEAYAKTVREIRLSQFPEEYEHHWADVRKSDKRYFGERRIRWLSPVLESRQTAWRCEWALKYYEQSASSSGRSQFQEITSVSSLPVLRLESVGLSFESENQRLLFGLNWGLSGDLGPSQIVPVQYFEIERRQRESGQWEQIAGNVLPASVENEESHPAQYFDEDYAGNFGAGRKSTKGSFLSQISSLSGSSWRIRAVNDVGIPGPWCEVDVSEEEMSRALGRFLRVSELQVSLRDKVNPMIDISWSVAHQPNGVRFLVERRDSDSNVVVMESDVCSVRDAPKPEAVQRYSYRVCAEWMGISTVWTNIGSRADILLGGASPGEVVQLDCPFHSQRECRLSWSGPVWAGHSEITHYEVECYENDWANAGTVDAAPTTHRGPREIEFRDRVRRSCGEHLYRVRAVNSHGVGPWVELKGSDEVGKIIRGRIVSIREYGAFVSLGDRVGLLHRSELDWSKNPEVSEVLHVGSNVAVKVIRVDRTDYSAKYGLSLREALSNPWQDFAERHSVGDVVSGTVNGLVDFGAFIDLGAGIKGLIHKSEFGKGFLRHPSDVLQPRQEVTVRIIRIDVKRERVALSLREL